jgi:glycosyltransferase involved in cell wall biosynthesis
MRTGISAFAGDGGKSGIGQYLAQIIRRLPDEAPEDRFVVFATRKAIACLGLDDPRRDLVTVPDWVETPVLNIAWHLFILPLMLRRHRCDLVYLPAGNRRLGWWYGVPSVGTVHDLAQLHVDGKYDGLRMVYVRRLLPYLIRRLTRVISVSEATRLDLVDQAGICGDRIRTIPNGFDRRSFRVSDRRAAAVRVENKWGVSGPYLLYVARLEHPGKNHVRLLEAFAGLRRQGLEHKLVLAGSRWTGADVIEARARELCVEDAVIFTGFVPNEDLPDLYAAADTFVFPSLFEGFGIPLLEAMISEVPVCASNRASIPEVVGDAGLLFDPDDVSSMEREITRAVHDADLRNRLVSAGKRRAEGFSWESAAGQVVGVLREAAA